MQNLYLETLLFTANTVMPIFLLVILGVVLKHYGMINDNFVKVSSTVVFNIALPALLFTNISTMDFRDVVNFTQISYIYVVTVALFIVVWWAAGWFIPNDKDKGVFVQTSLRSNVGVMGLAIVKNLFGDPGVAKAAMILALIIPLYNILSVLTLAIPARHEKSLSWKQLGGQIARNPLILGVVAALPVSYFALPIPAMMMQTSDYLSSLTMPLALLGIGGALNLNKIRSSIKLLFSSALIKLVLAPLALALGAYWTGFSGQDIAIIFVLFACPTAVASYVMVEAMGYNSTLAGNIILITTIGSMLTLSTGIFMLKMLGVF